MSLLLTRQVSSRIAPDVAGMSASGATPANFTIARRWAAILFEPTEPVPGSSRRPAAGDLVALATLDDIHQALLERYVEVRERDVLRRALQALRSSFGDLQLLEVLVSFAEAFGLPAPHLAADSDSASKTDDSQEQVLLAFVRFWLQRRNPAARDLVVHLHAGYAVTPAVDRLFTHLERFFDQCPGLSGASLGADLQAPIEAHPHSLVEQLEFMRTAWAGTLVDELPLLQRALDLLAEEGAPRWGGGGAPPVEMPALPEDAERHYAVDHEWMPRLVLAAKNTLVWLQQISAAYGREISRLDQIPEAELELLAGRGITGLWLIGLWERSKASREIKQRRGNPEAAASAYSLRGYRIAEELGGEAALDVLRERASRHGVRLAADMVPNHMGIDSDWVLDHPERFVSVEESPYPAYTFAGPDLSPRADVGLYLEDHYYDGSDAAVVFKHVDRSNGRERFIYHGNDGTSTPWNDTAQLDYLNPAVREAVIETILEVARRFPVIRFDAAMTLAKRHYHRLWHPQPGDAGAVPSRSEYSLSQGEFDRAMPREFWREVVDRVASERPDTLLLAEAFWLMEGYFVRTLGLHRVYNSAFMHLMRDQRTGKFRELVKETLAYDPEILRRYVNFMSNPDEETAAEQFGDDDRYFGVCTVLATLPGLPMFAHGQWDGLREKYGMEYRRSYRQEEPNRGSVERHDREIAPLLRDRAVYAGVDAFALYDFVDHSGVVRQEVLAFSNGLDGRRSLVVFNNSGDSVAGTISHSALRRLPGDDDRSTTSTARLELLSGRDERAVNELRDNIRGMSVLVPPGASADGISLRLPGFGTLVLEPGRQIVDDQDEWATLARQLDGSVVADPDRELVLYRLEQLLAPAVRIAEGLRARADKSGEMSAGDGGQVPGDDESEIGPEPASDLRRAASEIDEGLQRLPRALADSDGMERVGVGLRPCSSLLAAIDGGRRLAARSPFAILDSKLEGNPELSIFLVLQAMLGPLADAEALAEALAARMPLEEHGRSDLAALLRLSLRQRWQRETSVPGVSGLRAMIEEWADDGDGRQMLGLHEAEDTRWIVAERLDLLLCARAAVASIGSRLVAESTEIEDLPARDIGWRLATERVQQAARAAGYRVEDLVARLGRKSTAATVEPA